MTNKFHTDFIIKGEVKENGKYKIINCFRWIGMPEAGVAKALDDAHEFGVKLTRCWAETIESQTAKEMVEISKMTAIQ